MVDLQEVKEDVDEEHIKILRQTDVLHTLIDQYALLSARVTTLELENKSLRDKILRKIQLKEDLEQKTDIRKMRRY